MLFGLFRTRLGKMLRNIFSVLMLAPFVLMAIYYLVPPPSTLMLVRWLTLQSAHRDWVPLKAISPNVIRAVIVSEDAKFCTHHGVDWEQLQKVVTDADDDGPSRGASTITMQVTRNLFLWQGRSYIRKGLEIPLALTLDALWPKRRILEVYLNIAEWGDGIFGIEAAAQHHFHHSAKSLSPYEANLLVVSLPNPIKRHAGRPGEGLQGLAADLAARVATEGANTGCLKR